MEDGAVGWSAVAAALATDAGANSGADARCRRGSGPFTHRVLPCGLSDHPGLVAVVTKRQPALRGPVALPPAAAAAALPTLLDGRPLHEGPPPPAALSRFSARSRRARPLEEELMVGWGGGRDALLLMCFFSEDEAKSAEVLLHSIRRASKKTALSSSPSDRPPRNESPRPRRGCSHHHMTAVSPAELAAAVEARADEILGQLE